jgi:uncharacterized protein (TIGR02421 family)
MTSVLPEGLLAAVRQRLDAGQPLRRTLPAGGRLHIDRPLPFLVVYRRPIDREDQGTSRLVLSSASYLIASGEEACVAATRALVATVVETLSGALGAFMIVELWTSAVAKPDERVDLVRVVTPDQQAPLDAVDELVAALQQLDVGYWRPEVRQVRAKAASPPGLPSLLEPADANRLHCYTVGIELEAMFRDRDGAVYPELVRELAAQLSTGLQRGFFAFSRAKTSVEARVYQGVGRKAVVRAVRRVDAALSEICDRFAFLLAMTPVDAAEAWMSFKESGCSEPPVFRYRPLTIEPEILLRDLYSVPLQEVEDPTLYRIFREKLREVARQLTMLAERNTHRTVLASRQLYGGVETELLQVAEGLLATIPADETAGDRTVGAHDFACLAELEFARYRGQADFDAECEIRSDVSGLIVSKAKLLIDRSLKLTPERADALLQHEVGTHLLSYMNGRSQSLHVFRLGLAGHEALQEGLAVLSEYLTGRLTPGRLRLLAARVVAVERMIGGASFMDIFEELTRDHGLAAHSAFLSAMRVTRGGGLTKDALYLHGLQRVVDYVQDGGDLMPLFVGKIALEHVPVVEEILHRGVLREPPLRPIWLDSPEATERLAGLRDGVSIAEMSKGAIECESAS